MADHGDWILKIISGPHQGVEEMLPDGRLLVGTDPDCSIVLHDVLIAPQHFALTRKGGSVIVEALGGRTYCGGKRVTVPTAVPAFSFVTAGTTHVVVGPAAGSWPLLSSADAPELEKDPPPAPATPAAAPAGRAPAALSPAASGAPAAPTTPGTPAAPTPEQRRRAWWMVGFGGTLLAVWLVLWLLLRPAPSEPIRPSPKARSERVLGSLPGGNRLRIEERGDLLVISGYLDSDAAHRDLIAALRAEVPEATLRLWSTPRLVETARAFLASRKLNLTLTPGENGELKIAGTAPSAPEWEITRQMLLAEVPGLQNIIAEVTAPKEPGRGSKAATEPTVAPDKALTVIALQTLPEAPAWVRLANGAIYFAGGRFQGIATFTGLEGARARFEHDGGAALFGLGDDLAGLLPADPAKRGSTRLEPGSRRAGPLAPAAAPSPTPAPPPAPTPAPPPAPTPAPTSTPAQGLSDTRPVAGQPVPVAATQPIPAETTPAPAPAVPAIPFPAATPPPATNTPAAPLPAPVPAVVATPAPAALVPAAETPPPAAPGAPKVSPAPAPTTIQPGASSPVPAPDGPVAVPTTAPTDAPVTAPGTTVATPPTPAAAVTATDAPAPAAAVAPEPTPAPVTTPTLPVANSLVPGSNAPVAAATTAPTEVKASEPTPLLVATAPVGAAPAESSAAPTPASPTAAPVTAPSTTVATPPTPAAAVPAADAPAPAAAVDSEATPLPAPSPAPTVARLPAPLPALPAEYVKNPTEAKIRLISDALAARDAGDLAAAQRALALLAQLVPNDPSVLRFRADIEARVLAQRQARPTPAL